MLAPLSPRQMFTVGSSSKFFTDSMTLLSCEVVAEFSVVNM